MTEIPIRIVRDVNELILISMFVLYDLQSIEIPTGRSRIQHVFL